MFTERKAVTNFGFLYDDNRKVYLQTNSKNFLLAGLTSLGLRIRLTQLPNSYNEIFIIEYFIAIYDSIMSSPNYPTIHYGYNPHKNTYFLIVIE